MQMTFRSISDGQPSETISRRTLLQAAGLSALPLAMPGMVAAGVDARVDVWMGMPHGFPANIGRLRAAAQALDAVGAFLAEKLKGTST